MRIWEAWVKSMGKSGKRMKVPPIKKMARQKPVKIPEPKSLNAVNRAVMGAKIPKALRVAMSMAVRGNIKESLPYIRSLVNPGKKMLSKKPFRWKKEIKRQSKWFKTKESIGDWVKGVWNKVKNSTPKEAAKASLVTLSPGLFVAHAVGAKRGLIRGAIRNYKAGKLLQRRNDVQRGRALRPFRKINPQMEMRDQL